MRSLLLARRGENHRGQLSHLQSEFVDPLWPLQMQATQDCDGGSEQTTESSRKTRKLEWPIAYYYDEKKKRLFYLLLHISSLLDTIDAFIDFLVCMYVIFVLSTISFGSFRYYQARHCCFIHYFATYAAVVGNFIVCQCRNSITRIFL